MKTRYYIFFVFLLAAINVHAQYQIFDDPIRYSIYLGTSLPAGEFANTSGAKPGACVYVDATANIYKNIKWITSTNVAINGMKLSSLTARLSASSATPGTFTTAALLTGPCIQVSRLLSGNLFLFAQTGLQILFISDIDYTKNETRETLTTNMGAGYTYALGVTTKFQGFNASLRYQIADPEILENIHMSQYSYPVSNHAKKRTNSLQILMGVNL
jgi:hypothetical protein